MHKWGARGKSFSSFGLKLNFLLKKLLLARLRRSLASFLASDVNDEASKHKPRLEFNSSDQSHARGGDSNILETAVRQPTGHFSAPKFQKQLEWCLLNYNPTWLSKCGGELPLRVILHLEFPFAPFRLQRRGDRAKLFGNGRNLIKNSINRIFYLLILWLTLPFIIRCWFRLPKR